MIKVTFISHRRKAQCPPNPAYPEGIDIDASDGATTCCKASLPYPAECCGVWLAVCKACGQSAAITAAGRPDDPRSVTFACMGAKP